MALLCENCQIALPGYNGNAMDIDLEDSTDQSEFSPSTSTHPSSISIPAYYDEFQDFADTANAAMQMIYPVQQPQKYGRVGVLLLSFTEDDLGVMRDIEPLEDIFKNVYHYETKTFSIPPNRSFSALSTELNDFIYEYCPEDHEPSDQLPLLIVYYAGNVAEPATDENKCLWYSNAENMRKHVNWTALQTVLFDAPADVLLIFDFCVASSTSWRAGTSRIGFKETIVSCGSSNPANGIDRRSFTSALTDRLRSQAALWSVLTGAALAGHLYDSTFRLQYQPAYSRPGGAHPTARKTVALVPFPHPDAVDLEHNPTFTRLSRPDPSIARILLAVHIRGDPSDELVSLLRNLESFAGFLRNEHAPPNSVIGMSIEAVEKVVDSVAAFSSTSTLVLVSVPYAVWQLLPDHGGCRFVAVVSGSDLLPEAPAARSPEATIVDDEKSLLFDPSEVAVDLSSRSSGYLFSEGGTALDSDDELPPPYTYKAEDDEAEMIDISYD